MKVLKEEIESRIVIAARNEFIKNGFKKAPMRAISARSGIVSGSIYSYLKTEDDIFYAALKPLLAALHEKMTSYHIEKDRIDEVGLSM